MVVARTPGAREALKAQFQAHTIERAYEAIVRRRRVTRGPSRDAPRPPPARPPAVHVARARGQARRDARARRSSASGEATHVALHARDGADAPDPRAPRRERHARPRRSRSTASRHATRQLARLAAGLGHQALHARVLGFVHPRRASAALRGAPPPTSRRWTRSPLSSVARRARPRAARRRRGSGTALERPRARRSRRAPRTRASRSGRGSSRRCSSPASTWPSSSSAPAARLGHAEPARDRDERAGERARRVEEVAERRRASSAPKPRRMTQSAMHSSAHAPIESSVGTTRFVGRDERRRGSSYASWSFGPIRPNGPGSRSTTPMMRERQRARSRRRRAACTTTRRADAGPDEAAREAERAEDDEHDDADDVGDALGDDDGRRPRDRDAVRLEEDDRLEHLADLARRDREDEAGEEREEAVDAARRRGSRGARGRTPT